MPWPYLKDDATVMGYCTVADVSARLQSASWDGTTFPRKTQVEQFVSDTSWQIDARLAALGYTTPVTTPASALGVLRHWCGVGASALTSMSIENVVREPGQRTQGQIYWSMFIDWLKSDAMLHDTMGGATTADDVSSGLDNLDPVTGLDKEPVFHVRQRF